MAPAVVANALSETTRRDKPEVAAFVRELIMRQDAEGYARNCEALAAATDPGPDRGRAAAAARHRHRRQGRPTARPAGRSPTPTARATVEILPGVGHWTTLEAAGPVTDQLLKFL